ncbi:MAG: DUF3710 domain-containing protein [Nocardioides sp.]|nr:DUF3710 domain-containing protein [Nocardioides sp.]
MKFRRKSAETPVPDSAASAADPVIPADPVDPTSGPFDVSQVRHDGVDRADLGALLIPAIPGRELRLQIEEATGRVQAVVLVGQDGALEFQAFAAPRNGDLWSTVRPQIADDLASRGGKATEREGRWGIELVCEVPVKRPDGTVQTQPSRIIGINGERWLLRASLLGRPALEPDTAGEWEDALAQVVVNRGTEAMPVGEPLPVRLPDDARRLG